MTQIQTVDPRNAGPSADLLDAVRQKLGTVPNIFATIAHSPAALEGLLAFNAALGKGVLGPALREQIALAVAGENACDYCASAHTALAQGAGVPSDEAARNLRGEASDSRVTEILSFARALVRERGRVDSSAVTRFRDAGITDAELVEIIAHVGVNLFTNYFNHLAGTEIDFPPVSAAA